MADAQNGKKLNKHWKLKVFLGSLLLLVVGFYVYKYTYIYTERRKYGQAEQVITKVADDLRGQGIQTSTFKNCERAQEKYSKGFISCHVGIIYEGNDNILGVKEPLEKFVKSVRANNFILLHTFGLSPTDTPINVGASNYSAPNNLLPCSLSYDKEDDSAYPYTLTLSCGKSSKFAIFTI